MTSLRFFIAALLVLGAVMSASAASVKPSPPADKCFTRTQECCFKYVQCGSSTSQSTKLVPCPQEQCVQACKPVCSAASSKRPVEKCADVKVPAGQTCKESKVHGHWKKTCTPNFKIVNKCKTAFVITKTSSCKNVCNTECKIVTVQCKKTEVRTFVQFCAKLSCGKHMGEVPAPKPVISKKPISVKMLSAKKH